MKPTVGFFIEVSLNMVVAKPRFAQTTWENRQERKLVIGTRTGSPPFAYVNKNKNG
jgi:hypothetical protein